MQRQVLVHDHHVLGPPLLVRVPTLEQLHDYRGPLAVEQPQLLLEPVHDHHVQVLQQQRAARHEYRLRQAYLRDKLFSISIACSARSLLPRVRHAHHEQRLLYLHGRRVQHDLHRREHLPEHEHPLL